MTAPKTHAPRTEHSVPLFWPLAAGVELGAAGLEMFAENLKFLGEAAEISEPPEPEWATQNRIALDLPTMRLREFSRPGARADAVPVIVDAPFAGHSSTIADYAPGQSLVETLLDRGLARVFVTDWKTAAPEMANFSIDTYLAEINVVIDDLGGRANLVGLCQGGWMSAMTAARFPGKVASLVLAGSPIDTDAGDGPIKRMAQETPLEFYQDLVRAGDGVMPGRTMLAGWKNMHPEQQYVGKYLDLYAHIEDESWIERTERFESWYENPLDLPGAYYLQAIELLFQKNLFAKGAFVALGKKLNLKDVTCPAWLLAGAGDDITTKEQVFAAKGLLGTPQAEIVENLVPGGHIGLFMGSRTLKEAWPAIADWIAAKGDAK